jgi:origin recognition complex subunit 1
MRSYAFACGAQVLYNLCEWPSRPGARLALLGIANTLDLPDRLAPRIASRLGSRRRAPASTQLMRLPARLMHHAPAARKHRSKCCAQHVPTCSIS